VTNEWHDPINRLLVKVVSFELEIAQARGMNLERSINSLWSPTTIRTTRMKVGTKPTTRGTDTVSKAKVFSTRSNHISLGRYKPTTNNNNKEIQRKRQKNNKRKKEEKRKKKIPTTK